MYNKSGLRQKKRGCNEKKERGETHSHERTDERILFDPPLLPLPRYRPETNSHSLPPSFLRGGAASLTPSKRGRRLFHRRTTLLFASAVNTERWRRRRRGIDCWKRGTDLTLSPPPSSLPPPLPPPTSLSATYPGSLFIWAGCVGWCVGKRKRKKMESPAAVTLSSPPSLSSSSFFDISPLNA